LRHAPRRRWFRFSLRTMFVVVTLVGCWLGYELHWLRQRRAFIAHETAIRDAQKEWWSTIALTAAPGKSPPWAPGGLWLFGEPGYSFVYFISDSGTPPESRTLTANDRDRLATARRLFPEATVGVTALWDTPEESGVGSWRPDP
jgi:hypothetical protein